MEVNDFLFNIYICTHIHTWEPNERKFLKPIYTLQVEVE